MTIFNSYVSLPEGISPSYPYEITFFFAQNPEPPASSDRTGGHEPSAHANWTRGVQHHQAAMPNRMIHLGSYAGFHQWGYQTKWMVDNEQSFYWWFRRSPVLGNLCIYIYIHYLYIIWFIYMLLWYLGYMIYIYICIYIMIHNQFHGDLIGGYIYRDDQWSCVIQCL